MSWIKNDGLQVPIKPKAILLVRYETGLHNAGLAKEFINNKRLPNNITHYMIVKDEIQEYSGPWTWKEENSGYAGSLRFHGLEVINIQPDTLTKSMVELTNYLNSNFEDR